MQLATLEFTAAAQNVVLVGGTGTGKTHLATTIGFERLSNTTANAYVLIYALWVFYGRTGQYAGAGKNPGQTGPVSVKPDASGFGDPG